MIKNNVEGCQELQEVQNAKGRVKGRVYTPSLSLEKKVIGEDLSL